MAHNDLLWLNPLREIVVRGLAELVLSPAANDYQAKLDSDICRLEEAVRHPGTRDTKERLEWRQDIAGLRSLLRNLQSHNVQPNSTTILLGLAPLVPRFALQASAANYYVWLRHTLNSEPLTILRLQEVDELLSSEHIAGLVRSTELPNYLRYRLAIIYHGVVGRRATIELMDAAALIRTQIDVGHLVTPSARAAAHTQYDRSLTAIKAAISELDALAAELRIVPECTNDLTIALLESGERRKLVGMVLRCFDDAGAESGGWLRAAMKDCRECMDVAASLECSEGQVLRLRAAFEARSIAVALNDVESIHRLTVIIDTYRANAELTKEVASLDDLHARAEIRSKADLAGSSLLDNERAIRDFADLSMRASGLPEDRRPHVEDDARKIARTQQIQREFCRHLQPLQNLQHIRSLHTAYARPTKYTCECTLLHCSTRIETEEINVAINAMRRNYCDGCAKRAPLVAD